MTQPATSTPRRASTAPALAHVVIPAYNEAAVLRRCLASVFASKGDDGHPLPVHVVVSANACTDDTATIAASYPGVTVIDRPEPGKIGALNAADAVCGTGPRIYLDADIELSPDALPHLIRALQTDDPVIASPHLTVDLSHSSPAVRLFYSVFLRLPYANDGLVGLGIYGLSGTARARFAQFPQVTADDLFIQRLFAPHERLRTPGTFTVRAPHTWSDLIAVRTRIARGNHELARTSDDVGAHTDSSTGATLRALLRLVATTPHLLPAATVYTAATLIARRRAHRTPARWNRDTSTR